MRTIFSLAPFHGFLLVCEPWFLTTQSSLASILSFIIPLISLRGVPIVSSVMKKGVLSALPLLATGVAAQQSGYGQCGGTGYTGETSCTAGFTCQSENAYYYQCVPGTVTSSSPTTSTPVVATTTSISSVDSLHPLSRGWSCPWAGS